MANGVPPQGEKQYWSATDLTCAKCLTHFFENPMLIESCASVGIENGKSTGLMLKEYFEHLHETQHLKRRKRPPAAERTTR